MGRVPGPPPPVRYGITLSDLVRVKGFSELKAAIDRLNEVAPLDKDHAPGCADPLCVEITTFNDTRRRYLCHTGPSTREHQLIHRDSEYLGVLCPLCRDPNTDR